MADDAETLISEPLCRQNQNCGKERPMVEKQTHMEFPTRVMPASLGEPYPYETEKSEKNWKIIEWSHGRPGRQLRNPEGIDAYQVSATFEKGGLRLTMSKPPAVDPNAKRITAGSIN